MDCVHKSAYAVVTSHRVLKKLGMVAEDLSEGGDLFGVAGEFFRGHDILNKMYCVLMICQIDPDPRTGYQLRYFLDLEMRETDLLILEYLSISG